MTQQEREKRFDENWDILSDIVNLAGDREAKKYLQSFIESEINLAVKAREEEIANYLKEKKSVYEPDLSYTDPDFRIAQDIYENCLQDTIDYLLQELKEIES